MTPIFGKKKKREKNHGCIHYAQKLKQGLSNAFCKLYPKINRHIQFAR